MGKKIVQSQEINIWNLYVFVAVCVYVLCLVARFAW